MVKALYEELKVDFRIPNNVEDRNRENNENNDDGDFFRELEGNFAQTNVEMEEENEISRYVKLRDIRSNDDPLEWWLNNNPMPEITFLRKGRVCHRTW